MNTLMTYVWASSALASTECIVRGDLSPLGWLIAYSAIGLASLFFGLAIDRQARKDAFEAHHEVLWTLIRDVFTIVTWPYLWLSLFPKWLKRRRR